MRIVGKLAVLLVVLITATTCIQEAAWNWTWDSTGEVHADGVTGDGVGEVSPSDIPDAVDTDLPAPKDTEETVDPTDATVGGDEICVPDCVGKDCGDDGCGGSCGTCGDDDPCNGNDLCEEGTCVQDSPPDCDDGNPCTEDSCVQDQGCESIAVADIAEPACDDGNPCTAEMCVSGVCVNPLKDLEELVVGDCLCEGDEDCEPLEDDNLCNGTLVCDLEAETPACMVDEESVVTCTLPDGAAPECNVPVCVPETGDCGVGPINDSGPCSDENACTQNESCDNGECKNGETVLCGDENPCTDDSCSPAAGCVNAPNTDSCDDDNDCTHTDLCADGTCAGTGYDCNEPAQCEAADGATCNGDGTCSYETAPMNGTPCDDGNACNEGEACTGGACIGGSEISCNDDNVCTDDGCEPLSGCTHINIEGLCTDDDPCTTGDHCESGACAITGILDCDDGNECTDDVCGPGVGCDNVPENEKGPCDDDLGVCVQGTCCYADCAGKECGDDGCGGTCGTCPPAAYCAQGICIDTGSKHFDGAYTFVPDLGTLGAKTYSFWFNVEDDQVTQHLIIKKDAKGPSPNTLPINIAIVDGHISASVTWDGASGLANVAMVPVEPGAWHYVVWQVSEVEAELYLDGALAGQLNLPGESIDNDFDYTVGGAPSANIWINPFFGEMYNLRISEGFLHDSNFVPCEADLIDVDSFLVNFPGPVPCTCVPLCEGKVCGDDGCAGSCGDCELGHQCLEGLCEATLVWTDPETGLIWQGQPADESVKWIPAMTHCNNLDYADYTDWRLPTIGELRSLIRGCPNTVTGGVCGVTDQCLGLSCDDDCAQCTDGQGPADGCYWPDELGGLCLWYWSTSGVEDSAGDAWAVVFSSANIHTHNGNQEKYTRCVRDVCFPDCEDKNCGDDGCGGSCGECGEGEGCGPEDLCVSVLGLVWVSLAGGTFEMGCSPGDLGCENDEKPLHQVNVSAFDVMETEVTQAQYFAVTGEEPSSFSGCPDCPVDGVGWNDATAFCEAVGGRLPSEAEWEYAARGGTTTENYCGVDEGCIDSIAWHWDNSEGSTHLVKTRAPNDFGLYDMLGNVWEWVDDWYAGDYYCHGPESTCTLYCGDCASQLPFSESWNDPPGPSSGVVHVLRGGSWLSPPVKDPRASDRGYSEVVTYEWGFRCARECTPSCLGKECGGDGCGGSCGECDTDIEECTETTTGEMICASKMVEIPAGNFWMGCNACDGSAVQDTDCDVDEHSYHEVVLGTYEMDRTEVTADQYSACVAAGGCTAASNYDPACTGQLEGHGDHPINCVSWAQAEAYCLWTGKRLPTEAEWEKGARGGCEYNGGAVDCKAQSRKYPWGTEFLTCDLAVMIGCEGDSQEVCSRSPDGDSPYGLCDLSGNVWEWTGDWYGSDYYCAGEGADTSEPWTFCEECGPWPGSPDAWENPTGPTAGSTRVLRGSGYGTLGEHQNVSSRSGYNDPSSALTHMGFRCARSGCTPDCDGKYCGDDFCDDAGGEDCLNCIQDCGCGEGDLCNDGLCCTPVCGSFECGDGGGLLEYAIVLNDEFLGDLIDVAWRPDGTEALIISQGGVLIHYDPATTTLSSLAELGGTPARLAWQPEGDFAYIVGHDGDAPKLWRYTPDEGVLVEPFVNLEGLRLRSVQFHPEDGRAVVTGFVETPMTNWMFLIAPPYDAITMQQTWEGYPGITDAVFGRSDPQVYDGAEFVITSEGWSGADSRTWLLFVDQIVDNGWSDSFGNPGRASWRPCGTLGVFIGTSSNVFYLFDTGDWDNVFSQNTGSNLSDFAWNPAGNRGLITGRSNGSPLKGTVVEYRLLHDSPVTEGLFIEQSIPFFDDAPYYANSNTYLHAVAFRPNSTCVEGLIVGSDNGAAWSPTYGLAIRYQDSSDPDCGDLLGD